MRRWLIGLLAVLVLGGAGGGIWYFGTTPEKTTPPSAKSAEFFLPEDPRLFIRFNHNREAIRSLKDVSMIDRLKNSRFRKALSNRILPLLSLVSDQFRANSPYPSQQLMRYFRHSESYILQARGEQPVFLMTPSDFLKNNDSTNLRELIEGWILDPARNRSNWSVDQTTVRKNPLWKLTYSFPDRDLRVSFHLTAIGNHGLLSFSTAALTNSIERYHRRKEPAYTLSKTDATTLVDFLVTHETPDTSTSLLANSTDTIRRGSANRLQGALTVEQPYVTLDARAAFPDTVPVDNIPFPRMLLAYVPPESYALNVLAVPSFDKNTPEEYQRLLRHRGQSLLAGRQTLMRVVGSLEGLELLPSQKAIGFASFYSDRGEDPSQSFLVVLKPTNPTTTKNKLEPFLRDGTAEPSSTRTYDFGPVTVQGLWHNRYLLLSGSAEVLTDARQRRRNEEGFASHENFRRIEDRVPETLTSFSYFSTSPLTDVLRNGNPIRNSQYQLAKTFLGFDPMQEVGRLVKGVPPNFLVTRLEENRNVSLKFHTAGDVFLPLALQRLNPEYRPNLDELSTQLPLDSNALTR